MEPQIRLRWTSHQGTMMSVFDALLTSESLVDVTLACEEQYIRAHKIILAACSPYFQALINIDVNKHPIFFLKDVKFTELKALVQYMYRGEVSISQEDLPSLLAVAQALKIRGLADVETQSNSISSDTIILPEHGTKNRVIIPTIPIATPLSHVAPPPAVVPAPLTSTNVQVPRASQQVQSQTTLPSSVQITTPVPTSIPLTKKRRMETRQSTQSYVANKVQKLSQVTDPLRDVDSKSTVMSSVVDGTQSDSLPSTTIPPAPSGNPGRADDRDFGNRGLVEDAQPFGSQVKLEANGSIEIDLEEQESSSRSSFPESWQMGDGDNSQLPDDDGELPGGSGNNDGTGAEGGEGFVFRCPNLHCTKVFRSRGGLANHFRWECHKEPQFHCVCGLAFHQKGSFKRHLNRLKCGQL